jgi:ABC-type multidrug transport system fused ATPase/permease subunit
MRHLLKNELSLLAKLLGQAFRLQTGMVLIILVGIFSSMLEIAGLAVLIPLTTIAARQPLAAHSLWVKLTNLLGVASPARFFMLAFFGLLVGRTITQLLAVVLTHRLNRSLHAHFATKALEAFTHHLSFNRIQQESIGHFVSIAGDDTVRAALIVANVVKLVPMLALFALYAALIAYQSWQVAVGLLVFAILVFFCLWGVFGRSHRLGQLQDRQTREAGTHFIETLSGLRTVRSFTAETYVSRRFDELMRAYTHTLFQIDSLNAFGAAAPTLLLTGGTLLAVAFFIPAGQLGALLPTIIVGIMMVMRLLPLANQTLDTTLRLSADLKAAQNISELIDAVAGADETNVESLKELTTPISRIEFDNVSFQYDESLPPVLDCFSILFQAGRSYAISGPSGVGKSTIADLLLKFQVPQGGVIRVNGEDIATLSAASLRRHAILAEQTVRIVFDSIARNIEFGGASDPGKIERVLAMVGLDELVAALPQGADTRLLYQGSNISGGQRQRVGLARALLRDADVLILDENTSALDHATREKALDAILPRYKDRIVIFIAHDPLVLSRVDEVINLSPAASALIDRSTESEGSASSFSRS